MQYAVKRFEKRHGESGKSQTDGLQQEIGVLKSVSHPNMLCLKDTFDEEDGVYLVLELAPEGELFNTIVMKQKLSEEESRKVFIQLFQGIKYLVCVFLAPWSPGPVAKKRVARAEHCPPRHQTRKHPSCGQRAFCQAR